MNGRRSIAAAGVLLVSLWSLLFELPDLAGSLALFSESALVQNAVFTSDTLNPASALTASGGASVTLSWSATPDTYASGHRVFRGTTSGGPYSPIADATPRTTTSYSDSPGAGTHYYVVRAFHQNWESANSNEVTCTRVLVFTC